MKLISKKKGEAIALNDAEYTVRPTVNGARVMCKYYSVWHDMIHRVYNEKSHIRHPTYKDVTVCDEWLIFSNFKAWMEKQDWKGKELDKDIIVYGNKEYHPDKCVFVSAKINTLLAENEMKRGKYMIRVTRRNQKNKFSSRCNDGNGKLVSLGCFDDELSAHLSYIQYKYNLIMSIAESHNDIRVKSGLINHANIIRERSNLLL